MPDAPRDVEHALRLEVTRCFGEQRRQVAATSIHRRGDLYGELCVCQALVPVLAGSDGCSARWSSRSKDADQLGERWTLSERREVRPQVELGAGDEVFPCQLRWLKRSAVTFERRERRKQRAHDLHGPWRERRCLTDLGGGARANGEERE
jgi:hypothetical protein